MGERFLSLPEWLCSLGALMGRRVYWTRLFSNQRRRLRSGIELVKAYTSRALTVPSDRVLAISGIAERYGTPFPSGYLAGLWQFSLLSQLLWSADKPLQRRPEKYQAPSWSWMSINGAITPTGSHLTETAEGFRIKVINCHVQPLRSTAPYGAVTSGYLKLRGRTRPAQWMRPVNDGTGGSAGILRQRNIDGWAGRLSA